MDKNSRSFGIRLAAIFLAVSGVLVISGYVYLSNRQAEVRAAAQQEMGAIADLKLREINNWREERLSDARFFARASFVAQDIRRFLDQPDSAAARSAVEHWLRLLKGGERYYAVMVFNGRLQSRLALPESASESEALLRGLLQKALETRDVAMSDLILNQANGLIYLDLLFPVFEEADPGRGAPIAAVLLKLDARHFLFPLVQSWPTPSQTAETLLVRGDGESLLFLNDLRHRSGSALSLRLPLNSPELPAAKVLRGQTNVLEGVDYRGVPVVAAGRMVPGTGWGMVAKMDREEVYAPLRRQMVAVGLVLGSLVLASGLLVALLWRQRSAEMLRLAKDDLARANAELERRVGERTAQLRESVAELEVFSYSLPHDLRAPLRAISNFSAMVLEEHRGQLGPDAALLEKVVSAAKRMDQLIRDVLALSRISRGELHMETVDLERLVRQVIQEQPELQAPRAQVCIEGPLPAVRGHEALLTQCLSNLLGNAVKFVARGAIPQVRVFAEANGDWVRLWVADNGIGIAPEGREKIFGMFQRLHSQEEYEGTGIGLAIVKRAVERMGGKAGVESEPGKGSRFWVELRAAAPRGS